MKLIFSVCSIATAIVLYGTIKLALEDLMLSCPLLFKHPPLVFISTMIFGTVFKFKPHAFPNSEGIPSLVL